MKRLMIMAAAVMAVIAAGSCDRYEDGRPSKSVRAKFAQMYPGAWDVEWEYQGNMWEVSFETGSRPNGTDRTAWYDMNADWVMTKTEIFLSSVPEEIKGYLMSSEFGTGQFDDNDAEFIQTPDGDFYRFDIRFDGREVEVDVNEDGKVSKASYTYW